MRLDVTPFRNAIARLREGLEVYGRDPSQTIIRDGLIQSFEFTYEFAHKMLKRALQAASTSPEQYDQMSFAGLIRSGNQQGLLLSDWPRSRHFRDMRAQKQPYRQRSRRPGSGRRYRGVPARCGIPARPDRRARAMSTAATLDLAAVRVTIVTGKGLRCN